MAMKPRLSFQICQLRPFVKKFLLRVLEACSEGILPWKGNARRMDGRGLFVEVAEGVEIVVIFVGMTPGRCRGAYELALRGPKESFIFGSKTASLKGAPHASQRAWPRKALQSFNVHEWASLFTVAISRSRPFSSLAPTAMFRGSQASGSRSSRKHLPITGGATSGPRPPPIPPRGYTLYYSRLGAPKWPVQISTFLRISPAPGAVFSTTLRSTS
jgi:hypothetical protein